MFDTPLWIWIAFNAFILAMLALDLFVFHRKAHAVSIRESLAWTAVWVALGLAFAVVVWWWKGQTVALEYLTGYVIEKSLSVDNIFVFLIIFRYFGVKGAEQHRVLFWGILGALVLRAIFIFAGVALIERFDWMIYVFGAFLIFTGVKVMFQSEHEVHPEHNPVLKLVRKIMPVTNDYRGHKFLVKEAGKWFATPLLLVLIVIETTDVIFALDSIPAILAITRDPFIVFSSNVFAILGLRALYFALAGLMQKLAYLHYGLGAVLAFVGVKMIGEHLGWLHVEVWWSLLIVVGLISISVVVSLLRTPPMNAPLDAPVDEAAAAGDDAGS